MCVYLRTQFLKKLTNMEQNVLIGPTRRKVLRDALTHAHSYIARECEQYGISMAELCRRAGVERSHFQRWKGKPPRTIATFDKLLAELDAIEVEQNGTADV